MQRLAANPAAPALLRGEIWVNPGILAAAGHGRGPAGQIAFAVSNGADLCFFPAEETREGPGLRGWTAEAHEAGLDCGVVLDGPFQRLAAERPLLKLLAGIGRDPEGFAAELARQMEALFAAADRLATAGVDVLLLTDDVAHAGGLYFSPDLVRRLLIPRYRELMGRFGAEGLHWGWHSDGRVTPILPDLAAAGFRIFSLETECVDLAAFKRGHRDRLCLGGIRAAWLAAEHFDPEMQQACSGEIGALIQEGGLILASSCGIHDRGFLKNLVEIYRLTGLIKHPCGWERFSV